MSGKNETPVLIASLLITAGLLAGGYWWLTQSGRLNLGSVPGIEGNASGSTTATPASSGQTFEDIQEVPAGLFNYGGSTSWAPVRGLVDPVIQQAYPSFQLRYTEPLGAPAGSSAGIEMLLQNQLSFTQSSRSLQSEERQQAQQQGYSLKEIPVALEGLAIAVNPNLPVEGLTIAQLRDIYLGNITNWSQIGGPNLAITPISRPAEGGTVEFFLNNILGTENLPSNVTIANTTTQALRQVDNTAGAIYYASAPEVVGQCTVKPIAIGRSASQLVNPHAEPYVSPENCPSQRNQINREVFRSGTYPLTRRLFVIVREDGSADQQAGEAYANLLLTEEGQNLLNEAGFVSIR